MKITMWRPREGLKKKRERKGYGSLSLFVYTTSLYNPCYIYFNMNYLNLTTGGK